MPTRTPAGLAFICVLAHVPPMLEIDEDDRPDAGMNRTDTPGDRPRRARPAEGTYTHDFRHVENWIFDLDNTLYAADATLMSAVEARICRFVQRELGLDADRARQVRKDYFRRYGTTLAGLMQRHGTDAEAYLSFVNDVDVASLSADLRLSTGLARLPGRRFVFTNNCGTYARRVLGQLGIAHLFDEVWDVRTTGFVPKPARAAYDTVVRRANIRASVSTMFDDLAENLQIPHLLGMTTVWLRRPAHPAPAHHHHDTDDLPAFLHAIEVASPA